ncbi:hypothetical protein FRX31_014562 [Thalictrum thalictroides]|uniref:Uncharacterized protein n=1 Tax=Thalictrum thalictroides TaxID=46969 RepID=A0A7J6WER0_THATH|nr:hypothetical protein FRX31_014562 [Thalictrum thalictroides]
MGNLVANENMIAEDSESEQAEENSFANKNMNAVDSGLDQAVSDDVVNASRVQETQESRDGVEFCLGLCWERYGYRSEERCIICLGYL